MIDYAEQKEGNIFFIPLFLPNDIKTTFKSYSRNKFDPNKEYAFGRLIDDAGKGGDNLVEIFNYTGPIPKNKETIIESGRLFDPIHVIGGFEKKRWRFIFDDPNYDKYKDSDYGNITFLLGGYDCPELWKGGEKLGKISIEESKKYNSWIDFPPTQAEDAIRDVLAGKEVSFY